MEPAYHLPPIHSPAKAMQAGSNSCRNKEITTGKTQLPPLKRVVAPAGIEKEMIKTPKAECQQQQTGHKKKRKKNRNRCRSHEPTDRVGKNDSDESPALSQSFQCAIRFNAHPSSSSSSPKVNGQHHFASLQNKEDCETTDVSGRYEGDLRIHEELYDTSEGKGQNKGRNYKSRTSDQLRYDPLQRLNDRPQEFHHPRNTETAINSTCVGDDGSSFPQVTSNCQVNSRREGNEDLPDEIRGTEKWFHQKRRGARIVQSKDHHHHPILALEFPPHPPPRIPNPTSRSQHVVMSHPNLPVTDSRLYPSNLSRNSCAQLRQVCMPGGNASSFASEFQPHPPLQPRTFTNYQLQQCRPAGFALETQAYQTSPLPSNTAMRKPNQNREAPSSVINDHVLSPSDTQPCFPTRVRLPPNCQWAIIDNTGRVTPLPPGTIPVSVNNTTNEAEDGQSLDPSDGISEEEELLQPKAVIASNNIVIESPSLGDLPKREHRCLSAGKVDELLPDGIFEKVPSSAKNCWKREGGKSVLECASQSNCKALNRQSTTEPYLVYLKESSGDDFGGDVTEQSNVSSCPNAEKKLRNFKLPNCWYSNSKNWFKSPFRKEKKHHSKTSTVPISKSQMPSLLSIEEFSSLNISDQERQMTTAGNVKQSTNEPKTRKSVYTLEEFLKVCEEDGDDSSDGVF